MSNPIKTWWMKEKKKAEEAGIVLLLLGLLILIIAVILAFKPDYDEFWLVGISLGLISIALGFIAIGMSVKSDKRHSDLLQRLDRNLLKVLDQFEPQLDTFESPKVQTITAKPVEVKTGVGKVRVEVGEPQVKKGSKEEAQKRLDEDTKIVGYVRGKIYQLEDGTWGIHWGGKYPL